MNVVFTSFCSESIFHSKKNQNQIRVFEVFDGVIRNLTQHFHLGSDTGCRK
jgi:hypothetical protein